MATHLSELSEVREDQMQAYALLKLSILPLCHHLARQQQGISHLNGMDSNVFIWSFTVSWHVWSVCRLLHRIAFSVQDAVSSGWHFSFPFCKNCLNSRSLSMYTYPQDKKRCYLPCLYQEIDSAVVLLAALCHRNSNDSAIA